MQRPECKPERGVFAASTRICRGILNFVFGIFFLACLAGVVALAGENPGAVEFHKTIRPLLENYCFDCHADGANKGAVFQVDPQNPDPGRVTVRRLNRVEYRNTVHDLLGVDFDSLSEFPPDDTGHGFDNIGDVLTLSPMLLEKYLD